MNIPSWDELFLRHVYLISSKSKDSRTKVGAVLVKDKRVISEGYNGICRGVSDGWSERNERPEKYFWYEHAERNSVFSCAYFGVSSKGSTCYTNGWPCCDCSRALIQGGIVKIVLHQEWMNEEAKVNRIKWEENFKRSAAMIKEAGIEVFSFNCKLGIKSLLDGQEIEI